MKKQESDGLTVNSNGLIVITKDQYREYTELLKEQDRTVLTLRAQMNAQEAEWSKNALRLARAVNGALVGDSAVGVTIVNQKQADTAYELANEILAGE